MSSKTLPASVRLIHPSEAQFERQYAANAAEWKGALTEEAYLRRERFLASQGLASNSGLTYWALVDANDGGNERVLAGCETLRKAALVGEDGNVTRARAYGIASVFTQPEGRGRGAASRMMSEVGKTLQSWRDEPSAPQCGLSILFSDIGKTFYAKNGWKAYPSAHFSLPPLPSNVAEFDSLPKAEPLYQEDLQQLCALDEGLITDALKRHRGGVAIAITPDLDTLTWHHAREAFIANEVHGKTPAVKGAIARFSATGKVWAIFGRFFYNPDPAKSKDNMMHILRLVVSPGHDSATPDSKAESDAKVAAIAAVLQAAQREAAAWNMEVVQLWSPDDQTLAAARRLHPSTRLEHRETESIASLRWYGDAADEAELTWLCNQKYAWC